MADIYGNVRMAESGGDRFAKNPKSSAYGPDQFLSSTWLSVVKKYRPDIAQGKTDAQILQLRSDEALSGEMTRAYGKENQDHLRSRGIDPGPGSTYLSHFAGPVGAEKVLKNPNAPIESLLTPAAIEANGFLRGWSGQQTADWAARKEAGGGRNAATAMASNLKKRFGTTTEGGAKAAPVAGGGNATTMSAGADMPALKAAVAGKSYDPDKLEGYSNITKAGQDVASKAKDWKQALLGIGTAGVGGYLEGQESDKKKEFTAALMGAVAGAKNPTEVAQLLIQSPDPKMQASGLELLAKNVGQAPQSRTIDGPMGAKIQQDYVDGQWVTAGGAKTGTPSFASPPAQQASQQPLAAPQAVEAVQPAPMPAQQPQGAPAPLGPMLGGPQATTENIGQVGPSSIPAQVQPAAATGVVSVPALPPGVTVQPNPVPKPPEGTIHKQGPGGVGFLYSADGQPVLESSMAASERGKAEAGVVAGDAARQKAAIAVGNLATDVMSVPDLYGRESTERAMGPWSGADVAPGTEGHLGASVNYLGRGVARAWGERDYQTQGGTAPSEVRADLEQKARALASVTKPFVRSAGEGPWTDADQRNLDELVGSFDKSTSVEDLQRRVVRSVQTFERAFGVKVPGFEGKAPKPNKTNDENAAWREYLQRSGQ